MVQGNRGVTGAVVVVVDWGGSTSTTTAPVTPLFP